MASLVINLLTITQIGVLAAGVLVFAVLLLTRASAAAAITLQGRPSRNARSVHRQVPRCRPVTPGPSVLRPAACPFGFRRPFAVIADRRVS